MFDNNPALTRTGGFAADDGAAARALHLVAEFVAASACGPHLEAKLSIIVEELVLNVIEHGAPVAGSAISVTLSNEAGGIGVVIADHGTHFDPREAQVSEIVPERGGGAGLALVREWSVIRDYACVDGANRLDLLIPADV
jgi:serine/threonine-protein kinase RsbW